MSDSLVSDDLMVSLSRNPSVKVLDRTDAPPARSWRQHQAFVDSIAADFGLGKLFMVVQRRGEGRGFWVSEWTVVPKRGVKAAARRRAAAGASLEAAVEEFQNRLSFHNSHFFRPEEGALGWFKRD